MLRKYLKWIILVIVLILGVVYYSFFIYLLGKYKFKET